MLTNAQLKKQRRKASREQRKSGNGVIGQFDLAKLQRKAGQDMRLRCKLADLARRDPAARTAKSKLNDQRIHKEFDRQGLRGFWNANAV